MKYLLTILLTVNAYAQFSFTGQIHKTVASAGTPERATSSDTFVSYVCISCSFSNSGNSCYFGNSVTNAVAARGQALIKPTATVPAAPVCLGSLQPNVTKKINLKDIWVDVATNSDEVNLFYIE